MRTVDKSKKSNIKCEHCGNWTGWQRSTCSLDGSEKQYYQCCPHFRWSDNEQYKNTSLDE